LLPIEPSVSGTSPIRLADAGSLSGTSMMSMASNVEANGQFPGVALETLL
jgi:hypothetical protein